MATKYTPDADCFAAANTAAGGKLTPDEINEAFQRVSDYKQKLQASGDITGMGDKLRAFAEREAERSKIAAALQKRHAALNVIVRTRLNEQVDGYIKSGMSPKKALLAVLEGTQKGVEGGRNSAAAMNLAYEARYLGGLFSELQATKPHLALMLRDQKMDADVMKEMSELREGGRPGITGNKDAQDIAKIFASYAELARTDLNKLGASIGKLDGWSGSQTHDDIKMIGAGKETWASAVLPKLDVDKTFPDLTSMDEVREALGDIFDTIITGFPNKPTPKEKGQRVNPANLAKSLGKSRVLHFKSHEAALAYREEFGVGNTVSGMAAHLRRAAQVAANMETLGPNPEVMFGSLVDSLKRRIKDDPNLTPEERAKQIGSLNADAGPLRQALDISTGLVSRPVSVTAAKLGSDIRAVQSMAKLGGAVLSSTSDNVTVALASQFRGSGFFKGLFKQLDGLRKGRPKGEFAEISYLLGEGFDGILGHIVSPAAAMDGPVGALSKVQEKFFRWNGLSWWTDVQRASAGRMISAEMGMRAKSNYGDLPPNYRHVLSVHGIDEKRWNVIRQAQFREVEGQAFVTPDRIRDLDDDAIAPLVADRIAAARKSSRVDEAKSPDVKAKREAEFDEKRAKILDDGRRQLELSVLRFFADETNYGVVEVDPRTRRTMTLGQRPGTVAGEAIRYIGQFKGFPMAFAQRVGGRALFGHRRDASFLNKAAHIGSLIGGMTMAGYMSMTMKDLIKGNWPPRDPTDPNTWGAAFTQGGAAGIYGDFLFGQRNRFGGGLTETAIGPSFGTAFDLGELLLKARDASLSEDEEVKMSDFLNITQQNTPFANLFYLKPALDYLFMNSLREVATPGYTRRQESRRKTEYGQKSVMPEHLQTFGR